MCNTQFPLDAAAAYKEGVQAFCNEQIHMIKESIKIARAVVTKAMGASPKNEGVEYDEELIQATIEAFEYECDSAVEEMSEGKEYDEDISDIEDEE